MFPIMPKGGQKWKLLYQILSAMSNNLAHGPYLPKLLDLSPFASLPAAVAALQCDALKKMQRTATGIKSGVTKRETPALPLVRRAVDTETQKHRSGCKLGQRSWSRKESSRQLAALMSHEAGTTEPALRNQATNFNENHNSQPILCDLCDLECP